MIKTKKTKKLKNFVKQIIRSIIVLSAISILTPGALHIYASSIFNLMGLVDYSDGSALQIGDAQSPNSFANARAYRSNVDTDFANSNNPSNGHIYPAGYKDAADPAYFLFDVGSSAWNPVPNVNDTAIVVLETYNGLNGWNGDSYVGAVKSTINQNHLNANGIDFGDNSLTVPVENVVMEKIPTPQLVSSTTTTINVGWKALWDNNTADSASSSHNSIIGYSVYRSDNSGAFELVGSKQQDPGQNLVYSDTAVVLGHNYTYKLRVQFEWSAHTPAYYETTAESNVSVSMALVVPTPDRIAFTSTEQTIEAGTKSNVITIQTRDEGGNDTPVDADTTIDLSSDSPSVSKTFFSASNGVCSSNIITNLLIPLGSSSSQFCYYDDTATQSGWMLTAHKSNPPSPDWLDGTQLILVNSGSLSNFQFNISSPQGNKIPFSGTATLTALDSYGNIKTDFNVATDNVSISVSPADGTLSGLKGSSNNSLIDQVDFTNGVADLTGNLTFSGISGFHTFTATSVSGVVSTSASIYINSAQATHLSVSAPSNAVAGTQFDITTITALDEYGNTDTNYNGVKIVEYSGPSNSILGSTPVYTTSVNFTNGVSTTQLSTILVKAETTNITINIDSLSGQSGQIVVSSAAATSLSVSAPSSAVAGINFNLTSITAYDQYGNIDTNYSGQKDLVYSGPGNGPVSGTPLYTTSVNFTNGVSTTALVTNLVKREQTQITITDSTISGTSDDIVVDANDPASIAYISGDNQTAKINTYLAQPLVVEVTDNYGNAKDNYAVTFEVIKGGGSLFTNSPITDTDGRASVNFRVGTIAAIDSDEVQAVIDGVSGSPVLFKANATPNSASNLIVAAPHSVTAGVSFNISLSVVDEANNIITDFNGLKNVSYSGAANSLNSATPTFTTAVEFVNGVAQTIPTTLVKQESLSINANIGSDSLSGTSNPIQVNPAITKKFDIVAPSTVQSGISFNLISLKTTDEFGNNTTADYSGSKTLTFSGPAVDPVSGNSPIYTTTVDFTNGQATTILATTLYKAEVTAIKINDGTIEGTSNSITVTYNEAYVIYYVSGNNQTGIAGQQLAQDLKVIVLDNQGNPAVDQLIVFNVVNGGGSVSTTNTIDSLTGEISTKWTLGTSIGAQSVVASVDGINSTITFNAISVADSASIITISPSTTSTYATYPTNEINVCLQDQFGNQVVTNIIRAINLNSTSSSGQFSLSNSGNWGINSANIQIGQSCVKLYYKDASAGSFMFTASSNTLTSGSMSINVLALVATTLIVAPTEFTVNENNTQQLTAQVYDQFNQLMSNINLNWEVSDSSAGSISQTGVFTPSHTAGTYSQAIKVSYSGLAAYSTPTVTKDAVQQSEPPVVVPTQPQLTPIPPVTVPTTEVTVVVDQDYFSDEQGSIPIQVEVPAVAVLSPKQGSLILSNGKISISGTSTPDQIIIVRDSQNNTLGSVTSDKNGYWKIFVGRNKFASDQGTITATVFKSNISTAPLTFDFKPRSIMEYLYDLILYN